MIEDYRLCERHYGESSLLLYTAQFVPFSTNSCAFSIFQLSTGALGLCKKTMEENGTSMKFPSSDDVELVTD
jgi:hypothetical protein